MEFGGIEKAHDAGLDRRTATDDNHVVPSDGSTPFAIYEAVEHAQTTAVHWIAVVVVVIVAELPGGVVNLLLQPFEIVLLLAELLVEGFEHARHGRESVGVARGKVTLDGGESFGIVDADAKLLILIVHRALVGVAEGKEREHLMLDAVYLVHGVGMGIEGEVAVGEHDALGTSCRAAGVDDGSHVVGADIADVIIDNGLPVFPGITSQLAQLAHAGQRVAVVDKPDVDVSLLCSKGSLNLTVEHGGADEDGARVAMIEDECEVVGAEGWVDGDVDEACQCTAHIEEVPLGAVARDADDFVARLIPFGQQAIGRFAAGSDVIVYAVCRPFSALAGSKDVVLGVVFL